MSTLPHFLNPTVVLFSLNRAHSHCLHFSNVNTRRTLRVGSKIMYQLQLQALELLCLSSIQILRLLSCVTLSDPQFPPVCEMIILHPMIIEIIKTQDCKTFNSFKH